MKKRNGLKRTLALAVISVLVALSMFVGTTFAWFTDSVTSSGNIIASGKLDVTMEYKNNLSDKEWTDASTTAIFNYDNWEPGYTEVKYVKVANVGTLDFDYQITIYPNITPTAGEVNLSDVIDVYVLKGATANFTSFADVQTNAVAMGSMTDMMGKVLVNGSLYDEDVANASEEIIAIVLHMQETAGNEYMGLSAGDGFTVQLLAKQKVSESDSFGPNYDKGAEYDGLPMALVTAFTAQEVADVQTKVDNNDGAMVLSGVYDLPTVATEDVKVKALYSFVANDTAATIDANEYKDWKVDFAVVFNKDVPAGAIGLLGEYGTYGWVGFGIPDVNDADSVNGVAAEDSVLVLETACDILGLPPNNWTYKDICEQVGEFNCGVFVNAAMADQIADGTTVTVELRLYNPVNPEMYVVANYVVYNF